MSATRGVLLSCRQLVKQFGGLVALNNLDLDVRAGQVVGVIGPNGSGKTTLFNVITGIFPLTSGSIIYDGKPITNGTPQQVFRAGIARTFQRSRLIPGLSIFDNLMIGNHIHLHNGVWANLIDRGALRLELKQMAEHARELMKIFDPRLVDRMDEPVGNQPMIDRRRIEICRSLMSNPRLLLLDEPSAGMTERETRQVMDNVLRVKAEIGDLTVILIEHEMNVIERVSDVCVMLNFGRKIIEGTYAQVVANPEVQTAYLGTRTREERKQAS